MQSTVYTQDCALRLLGRTRWWTRDGGDEIVLDPERFEVVCQRAVGVMAVVAVPIVNVAKQGESVPIAYRRERINVKMFAPNKLKLIEGKSR